MHAAITTLSFHLQILAWLAATAAIVGTQRLGRPFTDEERKRFGRLLFEHDYPGARLVALRFAYQLTRSPAKASNLLSRVDLRLVLSGWDPSEIPLVRRLCRLTWIEWTHDERETDAGRRAEERYLRELGVEATTVRSVESRAIEQEERAAVETKARARLRKLRAVLESAGDTVNLLWLDAAEAMEEGMPDLQKLAAATGRDVTEFYDAAKRRRRAVVALLREERGASSTEQS